MYYSVLIISIITILITYYFANYIDKIEEGWESYRIPPYNYVTTGADPIYYYRRDRYRKPYRWPFNFSSSYPYPHQEPNP